jgi:RNA polymerase sigma factor (sigma-70 family)
MATTGLETALYTLRRSLRCQVVAGLTDGELLERFVTRRDDDAFAALVRRHGPMVLGVCRRVLQNEADAEDAYQATFFVLVRKAASVKPRGMVGNWLYGVAHSTALKARAMSSKRSAKEREAAARSKPEVAGETWQELQAVLDQELKVLPDIYRAAIVLCDLEGKSFKEAARQLGCPQGTVGTRLARGRVLLSRRLARRRLTLSGGLIATVLAQNAAAAGVPPLLTALTIKAAARIAAGQATAGGLISAKVAALTEGVIMNMLVSRIKGVVTALLIAMIGLTAAGVVSPAQSAVQPLVKPATRQAENKDGAEPRAGEDRRQGAAAAKNTPADDSEPINNVWITDKRVQQELRLSETQVKKLEEVRRAVYKKYEAEMTEMRERIKKQDYSRTKELSRRIQDEERRAFQHAAPEILSASALKRLRQIQRQARGLQNLVMDATVQKKLDLNDDQVKSIEGFLKQGREESRKESGKRTGYGPLLLEDGIAMNQKAYAGAMKRVVGVFTEAQRRVWNDLVGETYVFKVAAEK